MTARSGARRLLALLTAVLLAAACEAAAPPPVPSPAATVAALLTDRIQVLATSDIHGRMESERITVSGKAFERGGVALLAGVAAQQRSRGPERTLLLDAGDTWQGAFISNANRGAALVQVMNRMGYDAQALGNHDFDWGQDVLRARAGEAQFPFLAANVIEEATGRLPRYVKPYVVKDLKVARVGIIGLTYPGSAAIVKATAVQGLRFLPAADAVRTYLADLRQQVDILVAVAHITTGGGGDEDVQLARDVPELDLVVGGHSHLPQSTALTQGKTVIVRPGAFAQQLARLELTVDPATRKVVAATKGDVLIVVASGKVEPDPVVAKIVQERAAEAKAVTGRVIGRTLVPLVPVRNGESELGNLVADAMLEYCRAQGWRSDVALHNTPGLRSTVDAGDISYGKLYEVLPFDNAVVSIELTGEQLQRVLDRNGSILVIADATYARTSANPEGSRITEASVGGKPLDRARVYRVCTIDYLALGGDGLTVFTEGKNLIYGDLTADVVAEHIERRSPVSPKREGRITLR